MEREFNEDGTPVIPAAPGNEQVIPGEEVDDKGVPLKNRLAEMKRKLEDNEKRESKRDELIAQLQDQIAKSGSQKQTDGILDKFAAKAKGIGLDDEFINLQKE